MLSIQLVLDQDEAEALAAGLARVAMDESFQPEEREVAAKALREIERARVMGSIRRRGKR